MPSETTAPREAPGRGSLTIEQLAFETGMSVRNIRSHQARGLLAPPEVRTRIGYYGPEHVVQLQLIRALQNEGFNLGGIKRLLDDDVGTAERLLRLRRTATLPSDQPPEVVTLADLAERFGLEGTAAREALERAQALGVLVPVGEDRYEVPAPELLAAAEEAVRHGIPLGAAISVIEELDRHSDEVARGFVRLFVREVWAPFEEADLPAERWAELEEAIEQLRPLASQAVLAIFQRHLSERIDSAFSDIGEALDRARP